MALHPTAPCPACGSEETAEIIYGEILFASLSAERESGHIVYGGDILREEGPHWLCKECKTAWCKQNPDLYVMDEFGELISKKDKTD